MMLEGHIMVHVGGGGGGGGFQLTPIISCLKLLPLSSVVFIMSGFSLTLISHFFLIFENFQNTHLTLNIYISAK